MLLGGHIEEDDVGRTCSGDEREWDEKCKQNFRPKKVKV